MEQRRWRKLGHIFVPDGSSEWMHSHAMIPIAQHLGADRFRIYFSPRDKHNCGHGAYLEIDMRDPLRVLYLHTRPVLEPGALGCFDDSGALPNALVSWQGRTLLYYTGINLGVTVKIRNSIGLAEWHEEKGRFVRLFTGPVIDRTRAQPHFCATPDVMAEGGLLRTWFTSCQHWASNPEGAQHFYNLEYAESKDGITWRRDGMTALDFADSTEYALGVPRVLREDGGYTMWFCSRGASGFPTYRIFCARSSDGIRFERAEMIPDLDVSEQGWDSEMVCYPFVFDHCGQRYMLYNGNGYGRTGFGLAIWE